jgi:hypothetical protein
MDQMSDYFETLTEMEKPVFSAMAEFAFHLGYKAKRDKSKTLSYTFTHRNVKKHILRFSSEKRKPIIKLKFFASQNYSEFFQEAIRTVIEEYDYKYTGCYGCGDCGGTQGYLYKYRDGREYYRCGKELIDLTDIKNIPIAEMLALFKAQHGFFITNR